MLRRRALRSRLGTGLFILTIATVLILGLPVLLPLVMVLHARDLRARRRAAGTFACLRCDKILGAEALEAAGAHWATHLAHWQREHPGCKPRMVRKVDAICTRCAARYRYDEGSQAFSLLEEPWPCSVPTPFFSAEEVTRLLGAQPVGEPLPFDPTDDGTVRGFYAGLVERIEAAQGLHARVEWGHYGSGYASFVEAWFYPADSDASLPAFGAGEERHAGLAVLLSRLSPYFVLGQDERSWSRDGSGGSGCLPNFECVDDFTHPALLPHVAPVTALLTAAGLRRLFRQDLAAFLPEDLRVPTILTDQALRQFDALFYWED